MANALLTWTLPTTREKGGPLDPTDITETKISMSADNGATFIDLGSVGPSAVQSFLVSDIDVGTYIFSATVVDTLGQGSVATGVAGTVIDVSPPSAIADLTVTIETP